MTSSTLRYTLVAVLGAAGACLLWYLHHTAEVATVRLDAQQALDALAREHDTTLKNIRAEADQELARIQAEHRTAVDRVAELDRHHTQELEIARYENEVLRDAVNAGTVRLRVKASCPVGRADPGAASGSPQAAGLDDGTAVELSAAAGRSYFRLRSALTEDQQKILGLQEYVRTLLHFCSS